MRINKFFAAALAATTLLASCAKDENGVIEAEGQETFAGFTISIPMAPADTRAGGNDATLATGPESTIKNVAVFVVGTSTVDKLYLENASDFTFDNATGIATATKAVRTTTGEKDIFVVTNYTPALRAAIDNMGTGAFGPNAIALDETNFMTMAAGAVESLTMTGKVLNHDLEITSAIDAVAAANLIPVSVYRNLAKVVVRYDNAYTAPTGGTHVANSVKFGLIAKANGAWLDNTENDGATATAYTTVPTAAKTAPGDAYWTNFSTRVLGTTAANWKEVGAKAAAPTPAMNGWYAHENIYGADGLYNGRTTIARICGTFIPTDLVATYNAATGERTLSHPSTAASFYRLSDGSYWSETAYASAIVTYDATTAPFAIATTSFSAKFDGGVGYYNITVMDDARIPTVKRNNYYDLAIETINGAGSPTEIPGDPTTPLEEEGYIAVKVSVQPWWKQSTGHDLQ